MIRVVTVLKSNVGVEIINFTSYNLFEQNTSWDLFVCTDSFFGRYWENTSVDGIVRQAFKAFQLVQIRRAIVHSSSMEFSTPRRILCGHIWFERFCWHRIASDVVDRSTSTQYLGNHLAYILQMKQKNSTTTKLGKIVRLFNVIAIWNHCYEI